MAPAAPSPLPHAPGFDPLNIVRGGLSNYGGIPGLFGRSLGAGGFGAGASMFAGGMAAMGIASLVGGVASKVHSAEQLEVEYDRLKRIVGDVGVSFEAVKRQNLELAKTAKVTDEEASQLTTTFARMANVGREGMEGAGRTVGLGIGLSRAYGLEPGAGVNVLGAVGGVGVAGDEIAMRKFALLLGETIAKSRAFAKAEEVMSAVQTYSVQQARQSLSSGNAAGYAGYFSALVGSGIPGLDPTGAASLLGRVNQSLTAGGARGEASQFFTAMLGRRAGLGAFETQILREGGAMATLSEAFGPGSVASRYGLQQREGNETLLSMTLRGVRGAYGNGPMAALAASGHLGISARQAMALMSVAPNQMGQMARYADLTQLSGAGISGLSQALFGGQTDLQALSENLLGRKGTGALTATEASSLRSVMAGGDIAAQREMLAGLVATRDQESTLGKEVRDSKAILQNIETQIADNLVPAANAIRDAVISVAGADKDDRSVSERRFEQRRRRAAGADEEPEDEAEMIRHYQKRGKTNARGGSGSGVLEFSPLSLDLTIRYPDGQVATSGIETRLPSKFYGGLS